MKHSIFRLLPILFFALFLSSLLSGQSNSENETSTPGDTTIAPITPYAITEISEGANTTVGLVQQAGSQQMSEEEYQLMKAELDSFFVALDLFLADTILLNTSNLNSRELESAESKVNLYLNQIETLQDRQNRRYKTLEEDYTALFTAKKKWELTKEKSAESELPEELIKRIGLTIGLVDSVASLLQEDMKELLVLQDRILERNNRLLSIKSNLQTAWQAINQDIFSRDMPNFFKGLSEFSDTSLIASHIQTVEGTFQSDLQIFKSDFSGLFIFIIVFFLILVSFLYWFKYNHERVISAEHVKLTELQLKLIQSPVKVSVFVASTFFFLAFPDLPLNVRAIAIVIMIIPLGVLAIRFFGLRVRPWVILLTSVFALTIIYELLYSPDILQRVLLMFLTLTSLVMYGRMVYLLPRFKLPVSKGLGNLIRNVGILFVVLLVIAFAGNLTGMFNLAEFFTMIPILITFELMIIITVIRFLSLALYLFLGSKFILKLNVVSDFFEMIHKRLNQIVRLFFWGFFLVQVLRILKINQGFFTWGQEFFTTKKKIGEAEISLESILIFVFVIWFSIFITKIVRYILEKDVFVRIPSSKGTPGTIIMMVRIVLISAGFFLAAAAAGMELTNLSIVLGAFSVGIGFGLQNIFNNMVSGFILAVERPISVGDTVEVGTLMGTVKNIGLRASKVRSFDGAEMIVPNGMLISDVLINWTLSDAYRRMDIRVGVAYGTDPNKVMDILDEVAKEHEKVRKYPEPAAFFLDFGESSLDFRLLAWVSVEDRLRVESELKTVINTKIQEAGIEIPFPQRDLHIRSDDTRIIPEAEPKPKPTPAPKPTPDPDSKPKPDTEAQV